MLRVFGAFKTQGNPSLTNNDEFQSASLTNDEAYLIRQIEELKQEFKEFKAEANQRELAAIEREKHLLRLLEHKPIKETKIKSEDKLWVKLFGKSTFANVKSNCKN